MRAGKVEEARNQGEAKCKSLKSRMGRMGGQKMEESEVNKGESNEEVRGARETRMSMKSSEPRKTTESMEGNSTFQKTDMLRML